jgi:hypothetical protein
MTWVWPVLAGFAASGGALIGSALILLFGDRARRGAIWLLAYAIGTLLGAVTPGMIPEALVTAPVEQTMWRRPSHLTIIISPAAFIASSHQLGAAGG